MAEERDDSYNNEAPEQAKKKSKLSAKLIIIIVGVVLVLAGAGFLVYTKFMGSKEGGGHEGAGHAEKKKKEEGPPALVGLDPFVVNLVDAGRYMKLTVQVELASKLDEPSIKDRMPQLRDAIILLLSSKSYEAISGSDGKLQLKEEMLARLNEAIGKDTIKHVYFMDFVVQ
ncbi:MAG: flagellar basal body-associated FliL family protein [Nitrospirae bacterium]|nr:flagellar basal body-associated FliL family protein [Nitrospirota bacterium]